MAWVPTASEVRSEAGAEYIDRHLSKELAGDVPNQDVFIDSKVAFVESTIRTAVIDGGRTLDDAALNAGVEMQLKNTAIVLTLRELHVAQSENDKWKDRLAAAEAYLSRLRKGQGGIAGDTEAGEATVKPRVRHYRPAVA